MRPIVSCARIIGRNAWQPVSTPVRLGLQESRRITPGSTVLQGVLGIEGRRRC